MTESNRHHLLEGLPKGHKLIATVKCDNSIHRISLSKEGQLALVDHGRIVGSKFLELLGEEKIPCMNFLRTIKTQNGLAVAKLSDAERLEGHYRDGLKQLQHIRDERRGIRSFSLSYDSDPFVLKTFNDRYTCYVHSRFNDYLRNFIKLGVGDQLFLATVVRYKTEPEFGCHWIGSPKSIYISILTNTNWLKLSVAGKVILNDGWFVIGEDSYNENRYLAIKQQVGYKFDVVSTNISSDMKDGKYSITTPILFHSMTSTYPISDRFLTRKSDEHPASSSRSKISSRERSSIFGCGSLGTNTSIVAGFGNSRR